MCAALVIVSFFLLWIDRAEAQPDQAHYEFSAAIAQSTLQDLPSVARRAGKEGYVKINFVISATGSAHDIWVLDHTDSFFVKEMQRFAEQWRFEPATLSGEARASTREHALVYEVDSGLFYATASQKFDTAFRQFMRAIKAQDAQKALISIKKMQKHKNNLLEETYYRQAQYYYAAEWGDKKSQYHWLNKALFSSNNGGRHLKSDTVKKFLLQKLALELSFKTYGAALETIKELQQVDLDKRQRNRLIALIKEIERLANSPEALASRAVIDPNGSAYFRPLKRVISIAYTHGNVSLVEAHCHRGHDVFDLTSTKKFRLKESYGKCLLKISGEAGTKFEVIES